jgi:ATP-dependent RNA helicase HelY
VERFDRVCLVLESLDYVSSDREPTDRGEVLQRIYGPSNLIVAEAIRAKIFDDLHSPDLAAVLSTLVYESRNDGPRPRDMPTARSNQAVAGLRRLHREISLLERDHRLDPAPDLNLGFAEAAFDWAAGVDLSQILGDTRLPAGDVVRWLRQVIDLASQIHDAVRGTALGEHCRDLVSVMRHGVVDSVE